MKLFLVHCGFYDSELCDGLYEGHVNFFVVAKDFDEARARAKEIPEFKKKRMHVDGLQEVVAVDGYEIAMAKANKYGGQTMIVNVKHRDLAPKTLQQN